MSRRGADQYNSHGGLGGLSAFQHYANLKREQQQQRDPDLDADYPTVGPRFADVSLSLNHHQQQPMRQNQQSFPLLNSSYVHPNLQLAQMQLRILRASNQGVQYRRQAVESVAAHQSTSNIISTPIPPQRNMGGNAFNGVFKETTDSIASDITSQSSSSKGSSNSLNRLKRVAHNAKNALHMKAMLGEIRSNEKKKKDAKQQEDKLAVLASSDSSDSEDEAEKIIAKPKSKLQELLSEAKKSRQSKGSVDDVTAQIQRNARDQMAELQKNMGCLIDQHTKNIEDSKDVVERNKENEVKKKLRHILKKEGRGAIKMPMWRHKLGGNANPPPELVLKGKTLLYAVVKGVISMIVRPQLSIDKRKVESKKRFKAELNRALIFYGGICDKWVSQNLKAPIVSTSKDEKLDLNFGKDRKKSIETRTLQLKVRVKAVIQAVVSLGPPDDHILDFFIDMVDDGNYFDVDRYLFSSEKANLDFDKYEGTRNMIRITSSTEMDAKNKYIVNIDGVFVDTTRVHMMISNFLLVKTLVNHLLLSPWNFGLCSKPTKVKTCNHFRMLASIVYDVVKSIDPTKLPPIAANVASRDISNDESTGNFKKGTILAALFPANEGDKERKENEAAMEALLLVRPAYASLSDLHSILFCSDPFWISARPYIDMWAPEMAAILNSWIADIVAKVLSRRFKKIAEEEGVADISRLGALALLKQLPTQRDNYQTPRVDRKKKRPSLASEKGLAAIPELDFSGVNASDK